VGGHPGLQLESTTQQTNVNTGGWEYKLDIAMYKRSTNHHQSLNHKRDNLSPFSVSSSGYVSKWRVLSPAVEDTEIQKLE
jgi:hypothetical protein